MSPSGRLHEICFTVAVFVAAAAVSARAGEAAPNNPLPRAAAELFRESAVWEVHLKFTAEQWAAMEPQGGGSFGGPPGRGGFGAFGFQPSPLLAPAMLYFGGADNQGRLSREAFSGLASKWFAAWDKDKEGVLDEQELRDGLGSVALPGRGFGMNLQGPEGGRNGIAAALGIEYTYVHANLEFEGRVFKDVAVRYKGGGTFLESRGSLKRPLKVSLNQYVKGQKLAGVAALNLANNVTDASWMNEVLAYRLYRDAGVPAPRTAYGRVYVTAADKHDRRYFGLYSIVENPDKNFAEEVLGTRKGALLKPVTPNLFSDLGSDWKYYRQTYDPKTELTEQQIRRVKDFCRLVSYADDAAFAANLGDFVDYDKLSRFMAVMVYLSDVDGILGPGQNLYLHLHPDTNKFAFIPWDQDHSFGQFTIRGTQQQREQLSIHRPWDGRNRFLERIFKVEAFKNAYLARLEEFSTTIFRPDRLARQVDELAAVIRPMVKEESAEKLARFEQAVAGKTLEQGGPGRPFGFAQPTKPIKPFVSIRTQSILDQLSHKAEGLELGFGGPAGRGDGGRPGGFRGPELTPARAILTALDGDKNGRLTREEFVVGFEKWFEAWNTDKNGLLTEDQLRAGMDKDFASPPAGLRGSPVPSGR
jgi:spore coat protein CotH